MTTKTRLTAFAAILGVASAAAASLFPLPNVVDYEQEFSLSENDYQAGVAAQQAARALLNLHGMEAGAAGLHIVQPPVFVGFTGSQIVDTSNFSGHPSSSWSWWPLITKYPNTIPGNPAYQLNSVDASIQRLGPNALATFAKVQTSSGWGIEATFESRSLSFLSAVHGPVTSSTEFVDWNGTVHPTGGTAPVMKATLVSNNRSYLPFDVSALIGQSAPATALVASDLDESEVDSLLELLEAS